MMKFASRDIEINGELNFSQYWDGEISQNFTHCFHCLKANFSNKNIKWNFVPSNYNLHIIPI